MGAPESGDPGRVGEAIRMIRLQRGLTISQLAALSGISPSYLCMIEQGERLPTRMVQEQIAKALEVDPDAMKDFPVVVGAVLQALRERDVPQRVKQLTAAIRDLQDTVKELGAID